MTYKKWVKEATSNDIVDVADRIQDELDKKFDLNIKFRKHHSLADNREFEELFFRAIKDCIITIGLDKLGLKFEGENVDDSFHRLNSQIQKRLGKETGYKEEKQIKSAIKEVFYKEIPAVNLKNKLK
jgi:hypothetical protein